MRTFLALAARNLAQFLRHPLVPFLIAPTLLLLAVAFLLWLNRGQGFTNAIPTLAADLVRNGSAYCLLALGASLVVSTSQIDLSSIGVATVSGIIFALVLSHSNPDNMSIWLLMATFSALVFAIASGLVVTLCFVKRRVPMLLFTWALGSVYVIISILLTPLAKSGTIHDSAGVGLPPWLTEPKFWEFGHVGFYVSVCLILAALVIVMGINLPRRARAVGASEESAECAGVSKVRTWAECLVLNAILACAAGIIHSWYMNMATTRDLFGREIIPIAIAVLGGTALTGGFLSIWSVLAAGFFWAAVRLFGPELPSLIPGLKSIEAQLQQNIEAELGQILFFTIFIVISLLFGKRLAPPIAKIFAQREF